VIGRPRTTRWLLCLLAAGAVAGGVLAVSLRRPGPPQPEGPTFPLPTYSPSAFRNTGPDARYIGSAACAACHRANHASYLLTPHSRALSDVRPDAEPPDGSYEHRPSGRSYRVYRKDGQLRHEELLRTEEGKEVARVDLPVRYLVGSGHFCRTYLVEADGFLHESPVTWYASKGRWDVSPGYDFPRHWGFTRPVALGCLACHAGRVEEVEGTVHRLALHEKAIGCENCHGPGSLHQDFHRANKLGPGEEDRTIVHPGRLARPLQEAICAACHLNGPAAVYLRGRTPNSFRPGTPLTDYRTHYRLRNGDEKMTVVGHVEQLRLSTCYRKAEELTCVTCHDPHARERPKDTVAYYRQKCLGCHADHPCSVAPAERRKKEPADNCAACHMPRGSTDIPHVAFTHHRIGRHPAPPAPAPAGPPELVPMEDLTHLSEVDRQRNLGLANVQVYRDPPYGLPREPFRGRARSLLGAVREAGLRDGETAQGLAEVYATEDIARAAGYAREALAAGDLTPAARAGALMVLAYQELQGRDFAAAAGLLREVVRLRRYPEDWHLLGMCALEQGRPAEAVPAFRRALAIRPSRPATHAALAEAYRQLGDSRQAAEHHEKARWLAQHRQE
jgi:predicted CXXCH cytochrome family protein